MSTRLRVLLGAGGVGKTTLAASYAIALARAGRRVGLLGIDPSRRLQGALGLELRDVAVRIPGAGALEAALLRPEESLRRWASEVAADEDSRDRLLANPFFIALADRLAGATDVLAAVRIAEWLEAEPDLEELVVDTAPSVNAIEFLRRPQRLSAFLEGRLVRWLRWLARGSTQGRVGALRGRAQATLGGLAGIGGSQLLLSLGEFLSLVEALFVRMAERARRTASALTESADLLLVTMARDDSARTTRAIADALAELEMKPRAILLNRALPSALVAELPRLTEASLSPAARPLFRQLSAQAATQQRARASLSTLAPVFEVEASSALSSGAPAPERAHVTALAALGSELVRDLG